MLVRDLNLRLILLGVDALNASLFVLATLSSRLPKVCAETQRSISNIGRGLNRDTVRKGVSREYLRRNGRLA